MHLEVRLFAMLREAAGQDRLTLEVPPGIAAAGLRQHIGESWPVLASYLPQCRLAASQRFVTDEYCFDQPEEVALIPPVSGG